jgi:hypothetical protein
MARKLALSLLAVLIDTTIPSIKLLACLLVLVAGAIAVVTCKPFRCGVVLSLLVTILKRFKECTSSQTDRQTDRQRAVHSIVHATHCDI